MQHEGGQPCGIDRQGQCGIGRIHRAKGPALIQDLDDGMRQHHQPHGRRQRQDQRKLGPPVERILPARRITRAQTARQFGQQHRAHRNRHHTQRQLIQAVGIDQPGNRALGPRGDLPRHQKVHLHHAPGQHRRPGGDEKPLQIRRQMRHPQARHEPDPRRRRPGEGQLRHPRDRHGPGQRQTHVPARHGRQPHGGDEHKVHQNRHKPRLGKATMGVQHTCQHGDKRNEEDIAKGDPAIGHRQIKPRIPHKARGHGPDQKRHRHRADQHQRQQYGRQAGKGVLGKGLGILARFQLLGIDRHEGLIEGPLGEKPAEHVGQRKGHVKGIGYSPRAQIIRHHQIACEPGPA